MLRCKYSSEYNYTMNSKKVKKYTHLFFDLDNTLTRSRSPITKKMRNRLESLDQDIVVITGADLKQLSSQLENLECFMMGQNGNHAVFGADELWNNKLNPDKVIEIMSHISKLNRTWEVPDETDLLENRGCQISYSIYGHHAPVEEKEQFDPDQSKRKKLLKENPLVSDSVEVKIAGTTTLDYTRKGRHKGYYVAQLIKHLGWNKDECLYFGDMLFEGGNDEKVIGVIDTQSVTDPFDTYDKLAKFL